MQNFSANSDKFKEEISETNNNNNDNSLNSNSNSPTKSATLLDRKSIIRSHIIGSFHSFYEENIKYKSLFKIIFIIVYLRILNSKKKTKVARCISKNYFQHSKKSKQRRNQNSEYFIPKIFTIFTEKAKN